MPVKRSAVVWLIFAAFALVAFQQAGKLSFGNMSAPGAGFFPTILAALLALISIIGLVVNLRGKEAIGSDEPPALWGKILLTITGLATFAAIFEFAGYLLTTFLFILFLLGAVERKSWLQAGTVALCAALVSYMVFGLLLGAPLPAGFLRG
jgi:hypothetical protein